MNSYKLIETALLGFLKFQNVIITVKNCRNIDVAIISQFRDRKSFQKITLIFEWSPK